jgi:hypothetical protein
MPHFHLSGMQGVVLALYIIAVFGAAHLAASSAPENRVARAWLALGF